MRGRVITATLLVAVGLVWIGQGLGLLRGSGFMVDDLRWAAAGLVAFVVAVAPVPGVSQATQVASDGPTVTSLPWRTSGSRIRRLSLASRSAISPSPIEM